MAIYINLCPFDFNYNLSYQEYFQSCKLKVLGLAPKALENESFKNFEHISGRKIL